LGGHRQRPCDIDESGDGPSVDATEAIQVLRLDLKAALDLSMGGRENSQLWKGDVH
jgi:hypothetical protein